MTATLVLANAEVRAKACRWIMAAPDKSRLRLDEPKRTTAQNSLLWQRLTQVTEQRPVHNGQKMTTELWKAVFLQALGAEMLMMPTLDGDGWFPLGHRSSRLSVKEMNDCLTLIDAWGAANGVIFTA